MNDLLDPSNKNLEIQTDARQNCLISKLTEKVVEKETVVFEWLEKGETTRKVASTHYNETSSRSHTVFRINLEMSYINALDGKTITKKSVINLVDLAGSEGVSACKNATRARETRNINKSLLELSKVISELGCKSVRGGQKYISYRGSKLTRILQNALSGNSKT